MTDPQGSAVVPVPPVGPAHSRADELSVVRPLQIGAAYAWRLLVVAAALVVLGLAVNKLSLVVFPVFLALFVTAILRTPSRWLKSRGLPAAAAAGIAVAGGIAVVLAIAYLIVPPFVDQLDDLVKGVREGVKEAGDWLLTGPLDLSKGELDKYIRDGENSLQDNSGVIAGGVLGGAQIALELIAGALFALVVTFFFLKDDDRIGHWFVGLFPERDRPEVAELGAQSWETLVGYLRGITLVALFDSVFIGVALVIVGVPAALPLAVFVFFGAYIPILGAVVTGAAAALVALVSDGVTAAIVVALAVLVVQQVESNLLHPYVVGRAVSVHPVVILLAVVAGGALGGIPGAVVAVPTVAVIARIGSHLRMRAGNPAQVPE